MTTTTYSSSNAAGFDFNQTYTAPQTNYPETSVPPIPAGTIADSIDGGKWIFVLASADIALGDVVQITASTSAATGITTANALFGDRVGVADAVAIASGDWGWVRLSGPAAAINVVASCTPNAQLATTSTAGVLDDYTSTGAVKISSLVITATNTAATTAAKAGVLTYPVVGVPY